MKTIEVPDVMYDKLMAMSKEINTQDHRCTAMPYIFQIKERKRIDGVDGDYSTDGHVWLKDGEITESDRDSMLEALEKDESDMSDDDISQLMIDSGYEKGYYRIEDAYSNAFLTEKACKEHIRLNGYHYEEPVDYLTHTFRNPDMELIFEFLCSLTGKEIHK